MRSALEVGFGSFASLWDFRDTSALHPIAISLLYRNRRFGPNRRYLSAKRSAIILWSDDHQAVKAAAHCSSEPKPQRDAIRLTGRVNPKADAASLPPSTTQWHERRLPSRRRVVPTETALAHLDLIG